MSMLQFNYFNIDNAQELYRVVNKNYDDFDRAVNWDRLKNWKALQKVIQDYNSENDDIHIELWYIEKDWDHYWQVMYYEERMNTYISITPDDWIEASFEFLSPIDVLNRFDDMIWDMKHQKEIYQIKYF